MSRFATDSPVHPAAAENWPGPKPPSEGWSREKFLLVLAFVLAFHLALIFLFGTRKPIVPRPVTNVPQLRLADGGNEIIALGDPTLFARPNAHDVVSAYWRKTPAIPQPDFNWTEAPHYLPPTAANFGATFRHYVENSGSAAFALDLEPKPQVIPPPSPLPDTMPQATFYRISNELAARRLLNPGRLGDLPSLPLNDVIAPTTVQARVDTAGNVISCVVLESSENSDADDHALQLTRQLRFAPAPAVTFGNITFIWHTVPVTTNNAAATP